MEWFDILDKKLFISLNGMHNSFFDFLMYWVSHKLTWIPLYAFLVFIIYKNFKFKKFIFTLIAIGLLVTLADQTSVHLFKNVFERYRPCHNLDLISTVHLINNHCGGQYGFVSSHATNMFALAVFFSLLFNNKKATIPLISWAIIVSYSRIYLGVHYPADVLGGAILGSGIALLIYKMLSTFEAKFMNLIHHN